VKIFCSRYESLRLSGDAPTFFFDKKVAKKQKSLQDLSGFVSENKSSKERASPRS